MASDLIDKIKLSIQETALRLISENNKAIGSPDVLIQSLQTHAEDLAQRLESVLNDDNDFGPTENEALHDVISKFFDEFDLARVIASTNQESTQKIASLIEFKNKDYFLKAQRLFRIFCESGDIPSFDDFTQQIESFSESVAPSDGFTIFSVFDSGSPRLVGSSKLPPDLIGMTEIDAESVLSKIRPHWSAFIAMIADELTGIEPSDNIDFADNVKISLEESEIENGAFKSLYHLERLFYSSHKTLGTSKIRGGIADLLDLIKVASQSRNQILFSDAWEGIGKILDTALMEKLKVPEWLAHFDPYTVLLSASGMSTSKATLIIENVSKALEYSETLFSELSEDLRMMLNQSGWISENGSLVLSQPTSASQWTEGDLTFTRNYAKATIANVTYSFSTPMQQSVLEWLIDGARHGQLSISEKDLLERLQRVHKKNDRQFKSLRDAVFKTGSKNQKKHPAWGTLIILKNKQVSLVTDKTLFSSQS